MSNLGQFWSHATCRDNEADIFVIRVNGPPIVLIREALYLDDLLLIVFDKDLTRLDDTGLYLY